VPISSLLILTGPPGSGKTTVAPLLAQRFAKSCVVESDWFWTTVVNGGIDPWLADAVPQNRAMIRASLSASARLANADYFTVLEGAIGPWHLDLVRDELQHVEFQVSYAVLRPSIDTCLTRAVRRVEETRHRNALTAEGPIRQLYERFSDLDVFECHIVDTSDLTASEAADRLLVMLQGSKDLKIKVQS